MIRNLMKLGVLAAVTGFSLNFASQTINEMVIAVHKREKTIAMQLLSSRCKKCLKKQKRRLKRYKKKQK